MRESDGERNARLELLPRAASELRERTAASGREGDRLGDCVNRGDELDRDELDGERTCGARERTSGARDRASGAREIERGADLSAERICGAGRLIRGDGLDIRGAERGLERGAERDIDRGAERDIELARGADRDMREGLDMRGAGRDALMLDPPPDRPLRLGAASASATSEKTAANATRGLIQVRTLRFMASPPSLPAPISDTPAGGRFATSLKILSAVKG